jgi:hypothetical protein
MRKSNSRGQAFADNSYRTKQLSGQNANSDALISAATLKKIGQKDDSAETLDINGLL